MLLLTPLTRAGPHIAWAVVDFAAKAMWAGSLVSSNLSVIAAGAARARRDAAVAAAMQRLRASLATSRTEAAVAVAAAAALRELAPSAAARVVVLGDNYDDVSAHIAEHFEAPSPPGVHSGVVMVDAGNAAAAAALREIFTPRRFSVGKDGATAGGGETSAGALRASGRSVVTSLDAKHGGVAFADWAVSSTPRGRMCATASLGCCLFSKPGSCADALPLLGFLSVHGCATPDGVDAAATGADPCDPAACDAASAVLAEAARLVGGAVAALRAKARHAVGVAAVLRSMGVPAPLPLHTPSASLRVSRSALHLSAPGGRRSVTFEADAARCDALEAAHDANLDRLRSWDLVGDEVSAAECRELIAAMFYSLGLVQALGLSATALDAFVRSVEARMDDQPYHSWRVLPRLPRIASCHASSQQAARLTRRALAGGTSSTSRTRRGCFWTRGGWWTARAAATSTRAARR